MIPDAFPLLVREPNRSTFISDRQQAAIGGRYRTRLVVKTAATDVQHGRLPREWETMVALNHRLGKQRIAMASQL